MKKLIIILVCILIPFANYAAEKKCIQVKFHITEEQYLGFLQNDEINFIEKESSILIADELSKKFGFFRFTIDSCINTLTIELADNEQNLSSAIGLKEVGFKLIPLSSQELGVSNPVYWVFRPIERSIERLPDTKEDFVQEIFQTFKTGLEENKEAVVKNILSRIEVAEDFYFVENQKFCLIPISDIDNNIAKFSLIIIYTSVPRAGFGSEYTYDTTEVFNSIKNLEEAIREFNMPSNYPLRSVAVDKISKKTEQALSAISETDSVNKKIFVLKYIPLVNSNIPNTSAETFINSTQPN